MVIFPRSSQVRPFHQPFPAVSVILDDPKTGGVRVYRPSHRSARTAHRPVSVYFAGYPTVQFSLLIFRLHDSLLYFTTPVSKSIVSTGETVHAVTAKTPYLVKYSQHHGYQTDAYRYECIYVSPK